MAHIDTINRSTQEYLCKTKHWAIINHCFSTHAITLMLNLDNIVSSCAPFQANGIIVLVTLDAFLYSTTKVCNTSILISRCDGYHWSWYKRISNVYRIGWHCHYVIYWEIIDTEILSTFEFIILFLYWIQIFITFGIRFFRQMLHIIFLLLNPQMKLFYLQLIILYGKVEYVS